MANFINMLSLLLTLLVFVYILSTWVFPPFHSFRQTIASIVEPMLAPIRRVIPPVGMLDFSPFILLIIVQVLATILIGLLG
ncbi:MAG: YggT family protein [Anaerolineales bacterium]|nr:YggT family protein [Anaerolineales bacterium]